MKKRGLFVFLAVFIVSAAFSRQRNVEPPATKDSTGLTMDGIRFEAATYTIDTVTHTATAKVVLTCLSERSRELKVNVYGTQLVDDKRNAYYFSTLTMGRVLMRFEDRQNYLHYLLQPDTPVELTITAQGISPESTAIQIVKIVFEDSKDEGRFLEAYLTVPAAQ